MRNFPAMPPTTKAHTQPAAAMPREEEDPGAATAAAAGTGAATAAAGGTSELGWCWHDCGGHCCFSRL